MKHDPAAEDSNPGFPVREPSTVGKHDPYSALRVPAFRRYMGGNFLSILGLQMQSAAVAWEVYGRTGQAISLAFVGLVQVLPVLGLAVFAGHVADRSDRRKIVMCALLAISAGSIGLTLVSVLQAPIPIVYGCLFLAGIARVPAAGQSVDDAAVGTAARFSECGNLECGGIPVCIGLGTGRRGSDHRHISFDGDGLCLRREFRTLFSRFCRR